jgi:hypothetical protein
MGGLVWFDKIFQACQGPISFIAYEWGQVIFEYSHVFHSGGSLMKFEKQIYFAQLTQNEAQQLLTGFPTQPHIIKIIEV